MIPSHFDYEYTMLRNIVINRILFLARLIFSFKSDVRGIRPIRLNLVLQTVFFFLTKTITFLIGNFKRHEGTFGYDLSHELPIIIPQVAIINVITKAKALIAQHTKISVVNYSNIFAINCSGYRAEQSPNRQHELKLIIQAENERLLTKA